MFATVRLAGSTRRFHHPADADPDHVGPLDDRQLAEPASVTVHLREAPHADTLAVRMARDAHTAASARTFLSASDLHREHGPAIADIGTVLRWASASGLQVGAVDAATRRIELTAPLGTLAEAFGVALERRRTVDWRTGEPLLYRDHREELRIPSHLDGMVTAVLGLSDRPLGRPRLVTVPHDTDVDIAYT